MLACSDVEALDISCFILPAAETASSSCSSSVVHGVPCLLSPLLHGITGFGEFVDSDRTHQFPIDAQADSHAIDRQ